jgi:hypothetical protein
MQLKARSPASPIKSTARLGASFETNQPGTLPTPIALCVPFESILVHKTDSLRSAPESPAYPMVDQQQDNGPYQ